ncbi:MAG: glycoside hydrolase family 3 C-terminal domain-containing protein, partial [Clostridia bacterium]|nr:glycoside hydrolase family 3 C-terminal domain-containing protein [Clostridia bacterium]
MKASEKIKRKIYNKIGVIVNKVGQNEAKFTETLDRTVTDEIPELLREAGAEGTVLLRNDNVLPLKKDDILSVFGRVQYDYMYVGYGSGGDVIKPYTVNLIEGLENSEINYNKELASVYENWCKKNPPDHGFWGHWPHYYEEMPIETDDIKKAAENSTCAAVVIGRSAGEDRENFLTEGSYLLTEAEKSLIKRVSEAFEKTIIILNTGSIMDMSWEKEILKNNCAIMYVWQSGMESGNAVADVLSGKKEPSGRLTDTIAESYNDYPCSKDFGEKEYNNYTEDIFVGYRYFETFAKDKVLYPFGFGLGYSEFNRDFVKAKLENDIENLRQKRREVEQGNDEFERELNSIRQRVKEKTSARQVAYESAIKQENRHNLLLEKQDKLGSQLWDDYEITYEDAVALDYPAVTAENREEVAAVQSSCRSKLRALGNFDPGAIEEYAQVKTRYDSLKTQFVDLTKSYEELTDIIVRLEGEMRTSFVTAFDAINHNFGITF